MVNYYTTSVADEHDPRGPDGVTLLAPYEQPKPTQHPGLTTGDQAKAMMLFSVVGSSGMPWQVALVGR